MSDHKQAFVLVSRELRDWIIAEVGLPDSDREQELENAPPGYSLDVVKAAYTRLGKNEINRDDVRDWEQHFDRWITEQKGGAMS
jgi:hypothetical protein